MNLVPAEELLVIFVPAAELLVNFTGSRAIGEFCTRSTRTLAWMQPSADGGASSQLMVTLLLQQLQKKCKHTNPFPAACTAPLFLPLFKTQISRASSYFSVYNLFEVLPFSRCVKCTTFFYVVNALCWNLWSKSYFLRKCNFGIKNSRVYSGSKLQKQNCSAVAFLSLVGLTCC